MPPSSPEDVPQKRPLSVLMYYPINWMFYVGVVSLLVLIIKHACHRQVVTFRTAHCGLAWPLVEINLSSI